MRACDDLYIKSTVQATGQTTNQLRRKPGVKPMAFEMMELTVETLDGQRIPGATYSWTVPAGVKVDVSSPKPHLIQADQVGEYKVTVSFGQGETCELKTELSGRPCQVFTDGNCNTAPVKIDTTAEPNANIPNLAIGDVFNAGDYEVTVTSLKKGSQTLGWTGEGMVEQNLIAGVKIPMSVVFENIKINSCYQYYNRGENGAVVRSKADASWGSVVDLGLGTDPVTQYINQFISIQEQVVTRLEIYESSAADATFFAAQLAELSALRTRISSSSIDSEVKTTLLEQIDALRGYIQCATNTVGSPNGRVAAYTSICSLNPWVALAKCLGASSLDIFGSYAFKWIELKLNGTPKAFSDYLGITSQMDWSGVLSSAAVSCVFSAIPIPTGKTAIAAMVGASGLSAAEAFSANVLTQYNRLRSTHTNPSTIVGKINWQESLVAAGGSGAITFISTALIRGSSHSAVLALKNRIVNIAEKKGVYAVRQQLRSLGFDDDWLSKIFNKWGLHEIKPLVNLPFKRPFTKSNYRDNFALFMGGPKPLSDFQVHHVFPQKSSLQQYWQDLGIDIHDPRFLQYWRTPSHQQKSGAYNLEWERFFQANPNANKWDVYNHGRMIMKQYGLTVNY
ncbi:MAG: DUF2380 domain-containing protein [Spirosomataceae bacterium]